MTAILTELSKWASKLPFWEQAALEKITKKTALADSDYELLLQYLLEDAGLIEKKSLRPQLQFPSNIATATTYPPNQLRLIKIYNLNDVNALVPGQTLTFSPAITAIYGANGSGKSGYARVFGCAGFTRGDKEILSDVSNVQTIKPKPSADIELHCDGINKLIHYQTDTQCPDLVPFYVFDSTSVKVHLSGSNTFSFSPAGLYYLTQLTDTTDKVREKLNKRICENRLPHKFNCLFSGNSKISKIIADLGPNTIIGEVRKLACLSPKEKNRINELDIEIARLKTQDITSQINTIEQTINDLIILLNHVHQSNEELNDNMISNIKELIGLYTQYESAAQLVSIGQFNSEHFTQTGKITWRHFIESAKTLADAEYFSGNAYPKPNDRCLLCHQPLSADALDLLRRLWTFLESDAQTKLNDTQKSLEDKSKIISKVDLTFFNEQTASYRYLKEYYPELPNQIITFIGACRQRKEVIQKIIATHKFETLSSLPDCGVNRINDIIKVLKIQKNQIERENNTEKISDLQQQLLTLQHRELLGIHLISIEEYVNKQIWAERATGIGGNTRHITSEYKKLFEQLVRDRYLELFEQTLKNLKRTLKVKVKTTGRKGETLKQIVLETSSLVSMDEATPEKVLSEGEKRAIALADFLTEVTLDTNSRGIILDDPVTSLDLDWRELIATILAKEAKSRQVIIFTHDLPFLYFLKENAEHENVEIATHWIKRGDADDKPGYVFLDNSPALERDYRKATKAREIYLKAKDALPELQESLLQDGFGALRTSYEAFIIFDLFEEVVMRFEERISIGRLKHIVWDGTIIEEVIRKYDFLSTKIKGHLHSDPFSPQKSTPDMLLKEIEIFETIRKKLKGLKSQKQ